jgi:hypothetical protein
VAGFLALVALGFEGFFEAFRFFDAFFFLDDFFFAAFFFAFFAAMRLTPFFDRDRLRGQVT